MPGAGRLPELADRAAADQLAVAGLDLLAATGATRADAVVRAAERALVALRRAL